MPSKLSNNIPPTDHQKIYRGQSLSSALHLYLCGQSRTPVPTMGMRVAEDVDPYKEDSNILMRSTLCKAFLLHLSHVEDLAQRIAEGLDDADDNEHQAEYRKGCAGVGGPDHVLGHFKGQMNEQLNECAPCAQRNKSAAYDKEIAAAQIMAKRGDCRDDDAKAARHGEGKGQKPVAARFGVDV